MLNSSSNNPGIGNLDGLKAKLGAQTQGVGANQGETSEPIIKEVYEEEPDDYNFVPQLREVDDAEIRNLSAIRVETSVDPRVYMACVAFLIAALVGGGIGFGIASYSAGQTDMQRKSSIARTIKNVMETRIEGLQSLKKDFTEVAGKPYDSDAFEEFRINVSANRYPFMLDMASDVTSEAVLLAGNENISNPLKHVREYSANSMLLFQLLNTHSAETYYESTEITNLFAKSEDVEETFAMRVMPDQLYYMSLYAPRTRYANGVVSIYSYKLFTEDEAMLKEQFSSIRKDGGWSAEQRDRRSYDPNIGKPKKKSKTANDKEPEMNPLPNHLIYEVIEKSGNSSYLFADEVILAARSLFFGKAADAKERYESRNENILKLIDETLSASSTVVSELDKFIVD